MDERPPSRRPDTLSDPADELREKKRLLAQLVVHDLRSPLSAVQGYLNLLREELSPDAVSPQAVQYIEDAELLVGKALGLVATILDVDELEDGILRAAPAPVKLTELIERARAGNRAHFEVRQLQLDIAVEHELVVRLDRDLFGRVLENLLDNATRYAPRGGRCAIAASRRDGSLEIAIGNSGPPVPEADRAAIFGRYFQVERRRASARANRGLGLYFCKLAVEAHGGTIHVEQRGDLGAVFVVRLPEQAPGAQPG
ncbi:MAG TPA: HAMP domain-containing sensor histidine kinase [Kofleriaceae bacterium]|nr:HAMP domain-containing sensor histidine kinase [Kofleriaceae bacterium]